MLWVAGLPGIALAQWPQRVDQLKLLTSTNNLADHTAVAPDGAGGVTVAWRDNRNSATTGRDIYAQRIDANGVERWAPNGVAVTNAAGTQENILLAPAQNGNVYAVWSDSRVANSPRIYAQRLDAGGNRLWATDGVRVGPNEFNQADHRIAADSAGNLFVTWREPNNNFRTFVQKFSATGTSLWGSTGFEYSSGTFEGGDGLNVVPDDAGGAVVGWIRFGDNPRTVRVQRILSTGVPAFGFVSVATDTEALLVELLPMASDGSGGAIVGWTNQGADRNLYVQRISGTGSLPWGNPSIPIVSQPGVQDNLRIVTDGAGGAYCAWDDARTAVENVYVQHVSAAGVALWAANGVPVGSAAAQRRDALLMPDGAGGAIATYRQNQEGIWSQRFNSSGSRLWTEGGTQITTNASITQPAITTDNSGGVILGVISFSGGNIPAVTRLTANGGFPSSRLVNISTRAFVGTGANLAISGFVITGTGSKRLLIRAVGPTLGTAPFNVPGSLADPVLTIFNSAQQPIHTRNDWGEGTDAALIASTSASLGAFPLPVGSRDAAMVVDLAPGLYTAGISGNVTSNPTGVGLIEVYDGDAASSTSRLINISSRVFVGTGAEVAIPGIVVVGNVPVSLLIRAVGPTLGGAPFNVPGVLADPMLTLFDNAATAVVTNANWQDGSPAIVQSITDAAQKVGAFALQNGSADAALLITLAPGQYTAGISGSGNTTGVCLVEVYLVP